MGHRPWRGKASRLLLCHPRGQVWGFPFYPEARRESVKLLDVFVKIVLQNRAVPSAVLVTEALLLDSVGSGSPIYKPASAPPLNSKLASSEQADAVQGDLAQWKCPPDAEVSLRI